MAGPVADILQKIRLLTDLYTRTLFSPHSLSDEDRRRAVERWTELRRLLLRARLARRFGR